MTDFLYTLSPEATAALAADTDGTFVLNETHVAEAIDHLIELFKHGPRNQAMLSATVGEIQTLENVTADLSLAYDIDTAVGAQLDTLGKVFDVPRAERTDDDYRAALRVKLLILRSTGTIPQMLEIAQALVPSASVFVHEVSNMTLQVNFTTTGTTTLRTLYSMLVKAKSAGVRLLVTYGGEIGSTDGSPAGGLIGAVDGDPLGFVIGGGT